MTHLMTTITTCQTPRNRTHQSTLSLRRIRVSGVRTLIVSSLLWKLLPRLILCIASLPVTLLLLLLLLRVWVLLALLLIVPSVLLLLGRMLPVLETTRMRGAIWVLLALRWILLAVRIAATAVVGRRRGRVARLLRRVR